MYTVIKCFCGNGTRKTILCCGSVSYLVWLNEGLTFSASDRNGKNLRLFSIRIIIIDVNRNRNNLSTHLVVLFYA